MMSLYQSIVTHKENHRNQNGTWSRGFDLFCSLCSKVKRKGSTNYYKHATKLLWVRMYQTIYAWSKNFHSFKAKSLLILPDYWNETEKEKIKNPQNIHFYIYEYTQKFLLHSHFTSSHKKTSHLFILKAQAWVKRHSDERTRQDKTIKSYHNK